MLSHKRSSSVPSILLFIFLCILLCACDSSTPTPTGKSTPPVRRTLTPGNGGGTGRIAFTCSSGSTTTICLSALDGSGLRQLPHLPAGACCPRWSPNGKRIAFSIESSSSLNDSDIWVMNADGSHAVRLTKSQLYFDATPTSWSPDGSKILFGRVHFLNIQQHISEASIWTINADGSGQTQLPLKVKVEGDADWQP